MFPSLTLNRDAAALHHVMTRVQGNLLHNTFSNLLLIRASDRPSTLTRFSICDLQYILTLPPRVS